MKRSYKNKNKNKFFLAAIIGATSLFSGAAVFADNPDAVDFSITVNPSLNLSVSSSSVNLDILPSSNGTFGKTDFTVTSSTNNMYGYTLKMSNNASYLESSTIDPKTGSNLRIQTLSSGNISEATFQAATSEANGLNRWGVAVDDGDYAPASTTAVLIKDTETYNQTADTTTINIASKLDLNIPAGTYTDTFNFQIVANVYTPSSPGTTGGSIDEAGGDNAGRTFPANSLLRSFELAYNAAGKPIYVQDDTVTSPIPGWRPMTDADQDTIGGKEVRFAMQDIGLTFEEDGVTKNVCEWAAQTEARAGTGWYLDEAYVMDIRDGKSYWITKLGDGKCWMTQNLALELDSGTTYTNKDTDLGWNGTGYSNASWTPGMSTINGYVAAATASRVSGWQDTKIESRSATMYSDYRSFQADHTHPGVSYNWSAAVASDNTSAYNPSTAGAAQIAANSICPAYWRLPIIADQNYPSASAVDEFEFINNTYNHGSTSDSYSLTGIPVYFKSSNPTIASTGYFGGSGGSYWSSVPRDGDNAYSFKFVNDSIDTHFYSSRSEGLVIRCVAR